MPHGDSYEQKRELLLYNVHAAETGLAVGNVAVVGAQLTLDRPIVQLLIISTFETIHYSLFTIH